MQGKSIENHVFTIGVADSIVSEEGSGGNVMETTSDETVEYSAVAGIVTAGTDAGVSTAKVVDAEIVEETGHILVSAAMQIIITPEAKTMYRIEENVMEMQQTLYTQIQIMGAIYNEHSLDVLEDIRHKLDVHILEQTVEWTTLSILVDKKGLTKDAIRKQLQNGDFEEGVDFKHDGNKIIVHQGAIGRLQRKRRSSNG